MPFRSIPALPDTEITTFYYNMNGFIGGGLSPETTP